MPRYCAAIATVISRIFLFFLEKPGTPSLSSTLAVYKYQTVHSVRELWKAEDTGRLFFWPKHLRFFSSGCSCAPQDPKKACLVGQLP